MSDSRCSGGSILSASRNSPTSSRLFWSGNEVRDSAYDPSASSTSRRRLRYSERNRLRKIVNTQAGMLVPGWNESICASARSKVSCTRSSARSILPQSEMAKARRLGTVARTWSRIAGSSFMLCPPSVLVLIAEAANEVGEMRRHALIDEVVVHGAQLLPDTGLHLPAQTGFFVGSGGGPSHWILALRLVRNGFEVGLTMLHHVVFPPVAHCRNSQNPQCNVR